MRGDDDRSGSETEDGGQHVSMRYPICYVVLLYYLIVDDAVYRLRIINFIRNTDYLMLEVYAGCRNVEAL